jgi:hypothetical protein
MKIKIKKGRHYPFLVFLSFNPIYIGKEYERVFIRSFMFTDSCFYDFKDVDQLDTNKLFGFSIGHHHKDNSFRFGWRPNIDKGVIEIMIYEYVNGIRQEPRQICEVEPNLWFHYKIEYMPFGCVYYTVFHKQFICSNYSNVMIKKNGFGYKLGAYFGGNKKAPHDIIIYKK